MVSSSSGVAPMVWRTGSVGAAAAAAINLVVYGIGRAFEVAFLVPTWGGGAPSDITPLHVVMTSIVPFMAGTALAAATARRGGLRLVATAGAALALLLAGGPLSMEIDSATKLLLASMHVVEGLAFLLALERARRQQVRDAVRIRLQAIGAAS